MSKHNVYLVQTDRLRKMPTHDTIYLPYAIAALWAYAKQSRAVDANYALQELIFIRDSIDDVVARMVNPFLVGFSCYVWNMEYNKTLAQAIKQAFPGCHILFGGHNVPPGGVLLEDFPHIDFLIHGEGEIPFQTLLIQLAKETPDYTSVPGLSYRTSQCTVTNTETVEKSVADYPSPYLEGILDSIIAVHPDILWSTVWETNRGCPHHCAYCDWGQHEAKVRQFPTKRLMDEIEWMSKNRVNFIYCADANFGIFARDEELLDALAKARSQTGFPRMFDCNTTKNIDDRLFRISNKLHQSGLDKTGLSLSVQSLSPEVLCNIGRVNIDDEKLSRWIRRCRQEGIRSHTDLIVGLPGETLQSFCAGVEKLYMLGQHEGIRFFQCNLLPNAKMAQPAFREEHKIRATRHFFRQTMEVKDDIPEFIETVVETAEMSHADWMTANFFQFLVNSTHSFGLLRFIAIFLHTEKIVSYADFYMSLLDFCHAHPDRLIGDIIANMENFFTDIANGEEQEPLQIPGFSFGRMWEDQYIFCRAVMKPERFYDDAAAFLRRFKLESALSEQLLRYQREIVLMPGSTAKTLEFTYDFPAYFNAVYNCNPVPLKKRVIRLRFSFDDDLASAQKYFHTIVQLGRFTNKVFYRTEYLPAEKEW